MTPTPTPEAQEEQFTIDLEAYDIAKVKAGLRFDSVVAQAMGVHPITWTRVLNRNGRYDGYKLTERVRGELRRVFPDDYNAIVKQSW